MKKERGKRSSSIQKTKRLTVSALICALGVVLLCAGRLFDGSLDLTMAALASLLCVWALEELGGAYPWMIWLATSLLALMLMPFNSAAWEYLLFAGLYPMLRVLLGKLQKQAGFLDGVFSQFFEIFSSSTGIFVSAGQQQSVQLLLGSRDGNDLDYVFVIRILLHGRAAAHAVMIADGVANDETIQQGRDELHIRQ